MNNYAEATPLHNGLRLTCTAKFHPDRASFSGYNAVRGEGV